MKFRQPAALILSFLIALFFVATVLAGGVPSPASGNPGPPPLAYLPVVLRNLQPVTFTHGIASGDITSSTATLWTRTNREAALTIQVSPDPSFSTGDSYPNLLAPAGSDFTIKFEADRLDAGETYYYRWSSGGVTSPTGVFHTPPNPAAPADVRFTFTGDADGTTPFYNNFEVLDAARGENADFFVYLGDTIYSDSGLRTSGPAVTLDEYRQTYQVNLDVPALTSLLASAGTYAIWDDHEVHNDFAGQIVNPTRYANGRQAFLEFMPIQEDAFPNDPSCASDPLFRTFRWGAAVDMVILDERSCRSAKSEAACTGPLGLDPAPTAPQAVRDAFNFPVPPPAGCLAAINDPARTFLGDVQMQLLKDFLLTSTAQFKFVINEVPIQQFYAYPYDRWEGYGADRQEILNFIRDNNIEDVIFLSADMHTNFINEVFVDQSTDPETIAHEFVTGPIASRTLQTAILSGGGPPILDAFNLGLTAVGMDCRHLDAYSYGLVELDASAGTATITLKDENGVILEDQVNAGTFCTQTLGP